MSSTLSIRPMVRGDVPGVVRLHMVAFRGFFLTFLGPRFLATFYEEAASQREIALVAEQETRIAGFVMGSTCPGAFFRGLLRRRIGSFAVAAAPAVIRRPSAALRVARALAKPRLAARPAGTATLMSLGVDPNAQGVGAGKALVRAFVEAAAQRGATRVDLTTDKVGNERANAFYRALGFTIAREIITPERRILNEYELNVPPR